MQTRAISFLAGLLAVGTIAVLALADSRSETERICQPGYAHYERLPPDQYYPIARAAYRGAGVVAWKTRNNFLDGHILDHIVPLCLGGTWDQENLQIQTIGAAKAKDALEIGACRRVCAGTLSLDEARSWFKRER